MKNPITNDLFNSKDLVEYKEYLEQEMVYYWNDYLEDHNQYVEEKERMEEVDSISDVDLRLEGFFDKYSGEIEHYLYIKNFCEELQAYGDFEHGDTIIHEDYFTEYSKELCEGMGSISSDLPWYIANHIDWDGVASELKQDYIEAEFEGSTYYMRS